MYAIRSYYVNTLRREEHPQADPEVDQREEGEEGRDTADDVVEDREQAQVFESYNFV